MIPVNSCLKKACMEADRGEAPTASSFMVWLPARTPAAHELDA
jgi:hypothetical protein